LYQEAVSIKGTRHGLVILLNPDCDYEDIKNSLTEKMETAKGFFRGAKFSLQQQSLSEIPAIQRAELENICISHGLIPNKDAEKAAKALAARNAALKNDRGIINGILDVTARLTNSRQPDSSVSSPNKTKVAEARPAHSRTPKTADQTYNQPANAETRPPRPSVIKLQPVVRREAAKNEQAILVRRSLRSGQKISAYGHVVILGDVNHGAEIVSGGSVMVLGHCRGVIHAGVSGDANAVIVAWKMEPTVLSIANGRYAPSKTTTLPSICHIAKLRGKEITIEPYEFRSER